MRKRPPPRNVRRVRPIGDNYRFEFVGKDGSVVQAESYQERICALNFERDNKIRRYRSQPMKISYKSAKGTDTAYVPDYETEDINGGIQLHEVTLTKRRTKESARLREVAALSHCEENNGTYIVHTEETDPDQTEAVNLYTLYGFESRSYCNTQVNKLLIQDLELGRKWGINSVTNQLSAVLGLPKGEITATICWMIWHGELETDMSILIFVNGEINKAAIIWRKEDCDA